MHTGTEENKTTSHVEVCNFPAEELQELHKVAQRESVAFPKWALGLLITILIGLVGSNGAIWIGLGTKSTSDQLVGAKAELSAELILARERLVKLEASIPKDYPPKWFEQQFRDLVVIVNENNKILNDLRVDVASMKKEKGL
jgi:hypothetical protein